MIFLPSSNDGHDRKLQDIAEQCSKLGDRNVLWRLLEQGVDKNSVSAIKEDFQNAVLQFQVPYFLQILTLSY